MRSLLRLSPVLWVALTWPRDGAAAIPHTFDFASKAPPRLSIMFSMGWFGIDSDSAIEPQVPAGKDPGYLNWKAGGVCALVASDPATSDTCIRQGVNNACLATEPSGVQQRKISSRLRPLTGIWSGTGRDVESRRKLDLMLSMIRRPGCRSDDGARIDAWAVQHNSVKFSSKYLASPSPAADFPYRMLLALYAQADQAGLQNALMPGFDETFYFNFSSAFGLGNCDDTPGNPRSNCLDAEKEDLRDLVLEAKAHPSALKVNGLPVILLYTDSYHPRTTRFSEYRDLVLPFARTGANTDFYVIGFDSDPNYFEAFDALAPWLNFSSYANAAGTSIYADSFTHALSRHKNLIANVSNYPGRLVFGGVFPGFDDFTRNWSGPCQERQLPPDSPRDGELLRAQQDFLFKCKTDAGCITNPNLSGYGFRGVVGETWDDWTEGSVFEPTVSEGADRLVRWRQLVGQLFGDPFPDPAGDNRLSARWTGFGQARNGRRGDAGTSPVTDLSCDPGVDAGVDAGTADAGTGDAGLDGGAGLVDAGMAEVDAGVPDPGPGPAMAHACGCGSGPASLLLASVLLALRRFGTARST